MATDLSLLARDRRGTRRMPDFAHAEPSALDFAQRLGWPRLPSLGEIRLLLADGERCLRLAGSALDESILLREADHLALRRILPDIERPARLVPTAIALLRAMSR